MGAPLSASRPCAGGAPAGYYPRPPDTRSVALAPAARPRRRPRASRRCADGPRGRARSGRAATSAWRSSSSSTCCETSIRATSAATTNRVAPPLVEAQAQRVRNAGCITLTARPRRHGGGRRRRRSRIGGRRSRRSRCTPAWSPTWRTTPGRAPSSRRTGFPPAASAARRSAGGSTSGRSRPRARSTRARDLALRAGLRRALSGEVLMRRASRRSSLVAAAGMARPRRRGRRGPGALPAALRGLRQGGRGSIPKPVGRRPAAAARRREPPGAAPGQGRLPDALGATSTGCRRWRSGSRPRHRRQRRRRSGRRRSSSASSPASTTRGGSRRSSAGSATARAGWARRPWGGGSSSGPSPARARSTRRWRRAAGGLHRAARGGACAVLTRPFRRAPPAEYCRQGDEAGVTPCRR